MRAPCALPWRCTRHRASPRGTGHLRTPFRHKNHVGSYNLAHSETLPAARNDLTQEDAPKRIVRRAVEARACFGSSQRPSELYKRCREGGGHRQASWCGCSRGSWSRSRAFWHTAQFRHISTQDHQFLGPRSLACARMATLTVPGDVRAVGATSDDA